MSSRFVLLLLVAVCSALAVAPAAMAGKPARQPADTTAPGLTITAPGAGATVAGAVSVAGTASDNTGVTAVSVKVDGGAYVTATGTTSWARSIDTAAYSDGTHTITAQARDAAGNTTLRSTTVTFKNAPDPAPTPTPTPPPADTTAPSVAIETPAAGGTVSGTVSVTGSASDDASVAKVEVQVDGGAFNVATGTGGWSWSWNTTTAANAGHTLTVRATDGAGNVSTATRAVTVSNTSTAPTVSEQMVAPEGTKILIYSDATGWTAQRVYDLLKPNAYELAKLGSSLTVKVQTTTSSQTTTSVTSSGGIYTGFKATIYLQAKSTSTFTARPDQIVAHEYGHAWTTYHLYMTRGGDWSSWLNARGLTADQVDNSYNSSKNEMIADDYRMLFGTATAVSQAGYINSSATDPRSVPGLKDFFVNGWSKP